MTPRATSAASFEMLTQLSTGSGVFKSRAGHLSVWRSPVPDEEAASTAEGMRLPLSPEAAQRLPGNAAKTVEVGTH